MLIRIKYLIIPFLICTHLCSHLYTGEENLARFYLFKFLYLGTWWFKENYKRIEAYISGIPGITWVPGEPELHFRWSFWTNASSIILKKQNFDWKSNTSISKGSLILTHQKLRYNPSDLARFFCLAGYITLHGFHVEFRSKL